MGQEEIWKLQQCHIFADDSIENMTLMAYNYSRRRKEYDMATIHEKLKMMREKAGLRQGQIAEYLGVTQAFISKVETGERNLTVDQLEKVVNLYGYSLAAFADMEHETHPIQFAFRAQDVSQDDLHVIADIGKIAINSRFMAQILEESKVG